jgi:hypothetical protein
MIRVPARENFSPSQFTQHSIFLVASAVLLVMLMSTPAWADTVNFADTTDSVVGTASGTRAKIGPVCGVGTFTVPGTNSTFANVEGCTATITGVVGLPLNIFLVQENGVVSDILAVFDNPVTSTAELLFVSDPNVSGTEPGLDLSVVTTLCNTTGVACNFGVPEQFSISSANDTVSFQSDTEGVVPEPASLALLGSGLMAIVGFIKRRLP